MDNKEALKMVVESLVDVNDEKSISVEYMPGDPQTLFCVGFTNWCGDLVGFSQTYYAIDKSGCLHALSNTEFQDQKGFKDYGVHKGAETINIQLSRLRVEPEHIILYNYLAYDDQSLPPEREMTVWSF